MSDEVAESAELDMQGKRHEDRLQYLEEAVNKLTFAHHQGDEHEQEQERRIATLEEQVASLHAALERQSLRHREQMAGFTELLGRTLYQQSQHIRTSIVYPTTIRSVPDEEESNEGTVYLTRNAEGEPVVYQESPTGMELYTAPGMDYQALSTWLTAKDDGAGNGAAMHRVNIYLDK